METIYLSKVPIFNRENRVYGFEIRYDFEENINNDFNSLIKSLYKALSDINIIGKVGGKPIFIELSPDIIIFTSFTSLLPNDTFIIKVPLSGSQSKTFVEKVKELRLQKYRFCLSGITQNSQDFGTLKALSDLVNYIQIDINRLSPSQFEILKSSIQESDVMLIAEKVNSFEDLQKAKEVGFNLFIGEFFTKPEKVKANIDNFSKLETFRLLRIVQDEDDLNKIAEYIKGSPYISVSLLKYINSSFFYIANPIKSINRAVSYLGKKNLLNWLVLISMISVSNSDIKKEAVKRALFRGKFIELLTKKINSDDNTAQMAFLIGIISLSDAIFNLPLETVSLELNFNQTIVEDIRERKGFFGRLLTISEMVEKNKIKDIKEVAADLTVESKEIMDASFEALRWSKDMFETLYKGI